MNVSRRSVLTALAGAILAPAAAIDPAYANALQGAVGRAPVTQLWLRRERTGEEVSAIVRTPDGYNHQDLLLLSWLMRDVADGNQAVWIDPGLFDLLTSVQSTMSAVHGSLIPLIVTSGYRTPRRNSSLEGAARASLHIRGCAVDVKAPGYDPGALAYTGALLGRGGVGIYPSFCHLDLGHVRTWSGGRKTPAPGTPIQQPGAPA